MTLRLIPFFILFGLILAAKKPLKQADRNVIQRRLVTETPSYNSILKENTMYHQVYKEGDEIEGFSPTQKKRFGGTTLVYVTPWNNHGHDIAKIFSCKFNYISPIWYNVKPQQKQGKNFFIEGSHNVDKDWISAIKNNKCIPNPDLKDQNIGKVAPRFLFDGWRSNDYQLLNDQRVRTSLINDIVEECKKQNFDGIVLEAGTGTTGLNIGQALRDILVKFIKELSSKLHENKMVFVLVQPPKRFDKTPFSATDYLELAPHIDFLSLMTYDYSFGRPGPNSPISWMTSSVLHLLPPESRSDTTMAQKILMGFAFYGYDFEVISQHPTSGAVLGHQYLDLLKKHKPDLIWDDVGQEHKFSYNDQIGTEHIVYYPSLKSIEERIKLAEQLGVGISIWEIGQGLDYFYDLL